MSTTATLRALAWSEDDDRDEDEQPQRRSWRTTGLLCAGIAVVTILVWIWAAVDLVDSESTTATVHVAPPTTTTVVVVPPPPAPAPPPSTVVAQTIPSEVTKPMTTDQRFLALIRSDGMVPNGDGSDLIEQAHAVCGYHAQGFTASQIIANTHPDDPQVTPAQEAFFVNLSINTYCP